MLSKRKQETIFKKVASLVENEVGEELAGLVIAYETKDCTYTSVKQDDFYERYHLVASLQADAVRWANKDKEQEKSL